MTGKLRICVPVKEPDRNGRVFTEAAAREMAKQLHGVPLTFESSVCGMVTEVFDPEVDEYGDVIIPVGVWLPGAGVTVSDNGIESVSMSR